MNYTDLYGERFRKQLRESLDKAPQNALDSANKAPVNQREVYEAIESVLKEKAQIHGVRLPMGFETDLITSLIDKLTDNMMLSS